MNHRPVAIGLVLCELVIVDEKSRNLTPVNCFTARKLSSFPGSADFHVVAWLADGLGEMPVEILVERLDTLDEVFRLENRLRFNDPLMDKNFVARIRDCQFPVAGQYVLSLLVDRELIAHRKFRVY
jgi:hypothetical protein